MDPIYPSITLHLFSLQAVIEGRETGADWFRNTRCVGLRSPLVEGLCVHQESLNRCRALCVSQPPHSDEGHAGPALRVEPLPEHQGLSPAQSDCTALTGAAQDRKEMLFDRLVDHWRALVSLPLLCATIMN